MRLISGQRCYTEQIFTYTARAKIQGRYIALLRHWVHGRLMGWMLQAMGGLDLKNLGPCHPYRSPPASWLQWSFSHPLKLYILFVFGLESHTVMMQGIRWCKVTSLHPVMQGNKAALMCIMSAKLSHLCGFHWFRPFSWPMIVILKSFIYYCCTVVFLCLLTVILVAAKIIPVVLGA